MNPQSFAQALRCLAQKAHDRHRWHNLWVAESSGSLPWMTRTWTLAMVMAQPQAIHLIMEVIFRKQLIVPICVYAEYMWMSDLQHNDIAKSG